MYRSFSVGSCVIAMMFAAILLAGCGPDEPTKPTVTVDPNAPPPPTPEEIAKRVITELGLDQPLPAPGSRMLGTTRETTLNLFRQQNAELSKTPEGQIALKQVQKVLEDKIAALENGKFWEFVVTYVDAFAIFQPGSKKYEQLKERALVELRKPRVTVKGLPEVDGQKVALLNIYVPLTSESFTERLSVGEEMHGIKFLGVFGKDRGVRLEYLETGERYVAYLPSQK